MGPYSAREGPNTRRWTGNGTRTRPTAVRPTQGCPKKRRSTVAYPPSYAALYADDSHLIRSPTAVLWVELWWW